MQFDSPRSRAIHAALLDIAKVFGQASLNMMKERTAQTQDALHPTRAQQAGKHVPPPLALYSNQKKFKGKKTKPKQPAALITSRVLSMHPPTAKVVRKHPRVLAQEYQRELELDNAENQAATARARSSQAAIVYAAPFIVPLVVIPPWDPTVFPHISEFIMGPNGRFLPHNDTTREDRL